jgi:hypothetical protein
VGADYTAFSTRFCSTARGSSSPFDPGGPVTRTTTDTDVISTTNADTMVIAGFGYGNAPPGASTGFNLIYSMGGLMSEYELFSSPQTNLNVTNDQSFTKGSIVDAVAIQPAPAGRIIRLIGGARLIGGVRLQ